MKIVYNKINGNILSMIPDSQTPRKYNNISVEDIGILQLNIYPDDIRSYKVVNGELVKRTPEELNPYNINIEKERLIQSSKIWLAEYLQKTPLLFTDGKHYSVTAEKQSLLNNAITVYQMKIQSGLPAELKWNATGEECTTWTLEGITTLALAIANYVEPLVTYQQAKEVEIRNCTTKEELEGIVIDYATV